MCASLAIPIMKYTLKILSLVLSFFMDRLRQVEFSCSLTAVAVAVRVVVLVVVVVVVVVVV